MARRKYTEAEVAAVVMEELTAQGWDCYPEVEIPSGRADIVAIQSFPYLPHRQCVYIVETKTSWSLSVLEQAWYRSCYAHYVSVAAPTKVGYFFERLCRERGIGLIRFDQRSYDLKIDWARGLEPRLQRHRAREIAGPAGTLGRLHEDMKRYAPGTSGSYSTPFKRTMDKCRQYVHDNPGATVVDIASNVVSHHAKLSSFNQAILKFLGQQDGIEARNEGGCYRFYPTGAPSVVPGLELHPPPGSNRETI